MKSVKYSKFTGDDLGLDAEDLLRALSDFFLESGYESQFWNFSEWNPNSMEALKQARQEPITKPTRDFDLD